MPDGVVNVVPSRRSGPVVSAMLHDPRVRKLSFTGSTEVGRRLLAEAADCVVSSSMELGGNAPFLVFDDADLDAAVAGAMLAKMRNGGEACTAANRFYVQRGIAPEFVAAFSAAMAGLRVGPGLEDGVQLGPLVNADSRDKVAELVAEAVAAGATVATGGQTHAFQEGFFYPATVLVDVPAHAEILGEEIFGPVAPVVVFDTDDRGHRAGQPHRVRPGLLRLHRRPGPRPAGQRGPRVGHGRAQPGAGLRPGRTVRRGQAERPRPRGRPRRAARVPREQVHRGAVVTGLPQ